MNATTNEARSRTRAWSLLVLCAVCTTLASCAALVEGKVLVPGTNQRLLVGNNGWPSARIWVEENGVISPVQIRMEKSR